MFNDLKNTLSTASIRTRDSSPKVATSETRSSTREKTADGKHREHNAPGNLHRTKPKQSTVWIHGFLTQKRYSRNLDLPKEIIHTEMDGWQGVARWKRWSIFSRQSTRTLYNKGSKGESTGASYQPMGSGNWLSASNRSRTKESKTLASINNAQRVTQNQNQRAELLLPLTLR